MKTLMVSLLFQLRQAEARTPGLYVPGDALRSLAGVPSPVARGRLSWVTTFHLAWNHGMNA